MEEAVGHQVLQMSEDVGRENPTMRRSSGFWRNWLSNRRNENNQPVSEVGVYPANQQYNEVHEIP
jgi:hypothetical protein